MRIAGLFVTFALLGAASAAAGDDAKPSIASLEDKLVDDDPKVRAEGAAALAGRFPEGAHSAPMLVDLLDDEDTQVVVAASRSLDGLGVAGTSRIVSFLPHLAEAESKGVVETLRLGVALDAMKSELPAAPVDLEPSEPQRRLGSPTVAELAASALLTPGSAFRTWIAELGDADIAKREMAAAALVSICIDMTANRHVRPSGKDGPERIALTKIAISSVLSSDELSQWIGLRLLARLRPRDAAATAAVASRIPTPESEQPRGSPSLRRAIELTAFQTLSAMGADAGDVAPIVGASIRVPRADVLIKIGHGRDLVAKLAAMSVDKQNALDIRVAAAKLLGAGLSDAAVKGKFIQAVPLDIDTVLFMDRSGLDDLGEDGKPLVSFFHKGLQDETRTASTAGNAVAAAQARRRARRFAKCLITVAPGDAEASAAILGDVDDFLDVIDRVPSAEELLTSRLTTKESSKRQDRYYWIELMDEIAAIGRVPHPGANAVAGIVNRLVRWNQHGVFDDASLRLDPGQFNRVVAATLGRIGPAARDAIPELEAVRSNGDIRSRVPAAQALRRIRAKK